MMQRCAALTADPQAAYSAFKGADVVDPSQGDAVPLGAVDGHITMTVAPSVSPQTGTFCSLEARISSPADGQSGTLPVPDMADRIAAASDIMIGEASVRTDVYGPTPDSASQLVVWTVGGAPGTAEASQGRNIILDQGPDWISVTLSDPNLDNAEQ